LEEGVREKDIGRIGVGGLKNANALPLRELEKKNARADSRGSRRCRGVLRLNGILSAEVLAGKPGGLTTRIRVEDDGAGGHF